MIFCHFIKRILSLLQFSFVSVFTCPQGVVLPWKFHGDIGKIVAHKHFNISYLIFILCPPHYNFISSRFSPLHVALPKSLSHACRSGNGLFSPPAFGVTQPHFVFPLDWFLSLKVIYILLSLSPRCQNWGEEVEGVIQMGRYLPTRSANVRKRIESAPT